MDVRQALMAKHCPSMTGFSSDVGMPLARIEADVLDVDCHAIAPAQSQDFAALMQKMDSQSAFISQGFEHLIKQGQNFDFRISQLEHQRSQPIVQPIAQPIVQYQQPDITPVYQQLYAQQQAVMAISQNQNQTNLAIAQMASAMEKLAQRPTEPTVINHFVDNSQYDNTHTVTVHGDNYGNINNDGIQKNGSGFLFFMMAVIVTMVVGTKIYGK